jgi:hypothetical protein
MLEAKRFFTVAHCEHTTMMSRLNQNTDFWRLLNRVESLKGVGCWYCYLGGTVEMGQEPRVPIAPIAPEM